MDKLHLLAGYLFKFEKIDGDDFEKLMKGEITDAILKDEPAADATDEETADGDSDEN